MSSSSLRVVEIENVKIIGYHYIQENKQKLFNRLAYILLQNIISQYQRNQYFQLAMMRSNEIVKQYISDAIELFMQQKIQMNHSHCSGSHRQSNSFKQQGPQLQNKVNKVLQQQIRQLKLQNQRLKKGWEKQNRKYKKLMQKNNILSQMVVDLEVKNKQQIYSLIQDNNQKIDKLQNQNSRLKQTIIRLEVTLQFSNKYNKNMNTSLDFSQKNSYVKKEQLQSKQSLKQFKIIRNISISFQLLKPRTLRICSNDVGISMISQRKPLQLVNVDGFHQQFSQNSKKKNQMKIHKSEMSMKIKFTKGLNSIQQTGFLSINSEQGLKLYENSFVQTQPLKVLPQEKEQLQQLKQQLKILKYLNERFQVQYLTFMDKNKALSDQKVSLVQLSNNLLKQNGEKQRQYLQKQSILHQQINQLCQLIESLTLQKNQLLNIIQQYQNNLHHSNLQHSKIRGSHQQSDHTQQSSNAPRKQHNFIDIEINQPEPFLNNNFNNQISLEQYIRKDIITKYLLQFLDRRCKGQAKIVLLNQIGECLHWTEPHFARVQLYSRRIKIKGDLLTSEESQSEDAGGSFKDKFFRFLTNESESQM